MSSSSRWLPAVVVAVGAAVATAHGLFEVAVASRVPGGVAWLYPLITDGLALVAYAATRRLTGAAAGYAWTVVVLSATVSGLAQAVLLAMDAVVAPPLLRFGVGAWPAVACALVAHLLHLLLVAERPAKDESGREAPDVAAKKLAAQAPLPESVPVALPGPPEPLPSVEPTPAPTADTTPDVTEVVVDQRVVDLARRLARGEDLTGPDIATEHGVSPRTGRRLLADARAHLEQHQPLHLVTRTENPA